MAEFDVLLSFAGPERETAQAIFDIASANGLHVFIDEAYQHEIWGQNLVEYLDRTYRERGMYVLILISAAYKARAYTRVERRAAFDRMIETAGEYVLPVVVDDTWLEGIPRSTAYLDLRTYGVVGVCECLVRKVGKAKRHQFVVPPPRADLQRRERLATALRSENPLDRHYAVRAFGERALEASDQVSSADLSILEAALSDPDPTVSREAANVFGRLGAPAIKAVSGLIAVLTNPHPLVREAAIAALGLMGPAASTAVPNVVNALTDTDAGVRETAANTLGMFGELAVDAVPPLVHLLEDSSVRQRAEAALKTIGPARPSALPELIAALRSASPSVVRSGAAEAIGHITSPSTSSIAALIRALRDDDWDVRSKAEAALIEIGASAEIPLIHALDNADQTIRLSAARILGKIRLASDKTLSSLTALLMDANLALRKEATIALGTIGPAAIKALPMLLGLLDDAIKLSWRQLPEKWGYTSSEGVRESFEIMAAISQALERIEPTEKMTPSLVKIIDNAKKAMSLCPQNVWNQQSAGRIGPPFQYLSAIKASQAAEHAIKKIRAGHLDQGVEGA